MDASQGLATRSMINIGLNGLNIRNTCLSAVDADDTAEGSRVLPESHQFTSEVCLK
jgi:hypothetical protein